MMLSSLLLLIPYVLILIALFVVFYNTVKRPGLHWLNKATAIMLTVFTALLLLPVTGLELFFLPDLIPNKIIYMLPAMLMQMITVILLIFFVIATIKIWNGKNVHVLKAVWVAITVLSITDVCWQLIHFFSWLPYEQGGLLRNILLTLLLNMALITPVLWMVISWMSLKKINRENRLAMAQEITS